MSYDGKRAMRICRRLTTISLAFALTIALCLPGQSMTAFATARTEVSGLANVTLAKATTKTSLTRDKLRKIAKKKQLTKAEVRYVIKQAYKDLRVKRGSAANLASRVLPIAERESHRHALSWNRSGGYKGIVQFGNAWHQRAKISKILKGLGLAKQVKVNGKKYWRYWSAGKWRSEWRYSSIGSLYRLVDYYNRTGNLSPWNA